MFAEAHPHGLKAEIQIDMKWALDSSIYSLINRGQILKNLR